MPWTTCNPLILLYFWRRQVHIVERHKKHLNFSCSWSNVSFLKVENCKLKFWNVDLTSLKILVFLLTSIFPKVNPYICLICLRRQIKKWFYEMIRPMIPPTFCQSSKLKTWPLVCSTLIIYVLENLCPSKDVQPFVGRNGVYRLPACLP